MTEEKQYICNLCEEPVGTFLSDIDEHLWVKHPKIIKGFLSRQRRQLVTITINSKELRTKQK